jgi:hypothetical protein
MPGGRYSSRLRLLVLWPALLSASIASAHVPSGYHAESGFARVKLAARPRGWRDDAAAIAMLAHRHIAQAGSRNLASKRPIAAAPARPGAPVRPAVDAHD